MEIKQLRYFRTVARLRSVTSAAAELGVTQPAVGMQIRRLEEDLGLTLFTRHSRGVRLTTAGKLLLEHSDKILRSVERATRELERFGDPASGTVHIGVTPSIARVLVPRLLEQCGDKHPSVSLLFSHGFTNELDRLWQQGAVDFAFVEEEIDDEQGESMPLYRETFQLIGATRLIETLPNPVPVETLASLPLVLDGRDNRLKSRVLVALNAQGLTFDDMIEIRSLEIRREYVSQQKRFCIAPTALFSNELDSGICSARDIELSSLTRVLQFAGPRVERLSEAESHVREMIVNIVDNAIAKELYGWSLP
ncbi:LysR family transcriptional regulator [Mameliella alba]|nr:LysR family transcriptional regulator [Mameliella alba]MBY6169608.1 LysR family transcriptional regulator [Mameliella alba]MBY6174627.1 LysR family transcriptional regulator [Mameliella alba]